MALSSYRDLIAWQKGIELVQSVYQATAGFPRCEVWGLSNQLRRAAVSIPSNIAEGQGRRSTRDFLKFLAIAQGQQGKVLRVALTTGIDHLKLFPGVDG